jgi:hypothetical protein
MTGPRELPDMGYQSWRDVARGCRHLADTLRVIGRAIPAAQSQGARSRERADANTLLSVHVPGLFAQAARLARAAECLAAAERLAEIATRYEREGGE